MDRFSKNKPINIGGAGIAGLTAAIHLKKNGYQPILFEKQSCCGESRFGDFEGLETWNFTHNPIDSIKSSGLIPSFKHNSIYNFQIHIPEKPIIPIHSSEPFFHIISRGNTSGDLDYEIQRQVENSGISIRFNTQVDLNNMDIVATGSHKTAAYIQGVVFESDVQNQVHLILGNKIAPYGYGYIIIIDGIGTLAVAFKKGNHYSASLLENIIAFTKNNIKINMEDRKLFGSFGSFDIQQIKCDNNNRLFIGEAGGFQDYLFGFGIQYAIKSGLIAAKSICENVPFNQLWKKELKNYMYASHINRKLFEKLNDTEMYRICKSLAVLNNPLEKLRKYCKPGIRTKLLSYAV